MTSPKPTGRPPKLNGAQIEAALRMRREGWSYADISEVLTKYAPIPLGREAVRYAVRKALGQDVTPEPPLPGGAPVDSEPSAVECAPAIASPEPTPDDVDKPWSATDAALAMIAAEASADTPAPASVVDFSSTPVSTPVPLPETAPRPTDASASVEPAWPPPPDESTRWIKVPTSLDRGASTIRVRAVRLGQRTFYVDESNRLWCDDCCQVFSVTEAQRVENRHHRVSLSRVALGAVIPTTAWPADRPRSPASGAW